MTLRSVGALLVVGVVGSMLTPRVVVAQRVGMLPPLVSDESADQERTISARVESALTQAGWSVTGSAELTARARRARVRCDELECAPQIATAVDLDWVGQLRLWAGDHGAVRQIVLTVVSRDGVARQGAADVNATEIEDAADRAVAAVLRRVAGEEDAVTLMVHGTPVGATVVIDGRAAGTIPWTGEVALGTHQLVVSHAGHVTAHEEVTVRSSRRIVIELAPEEAGPIAAGHGGATPTGVSDTGRAATGIDVGLVVGGGGVAAAGVALIIAGAIPFADPTTCGSASCAADVPISERSISEPDPVVLGTIIAAGSAMLVTGAVLLVLGLTSDGSSETVAVRRGRLSVEF